MEAQGHVEMLGTGSVRRNEREVDVGRLGGRQGNLGLFRLFLETLHGLLVLGEVNALVLLELLDQPSDDLGVPMTNQAVNLTFEGVKYQLLTDSTGFAQKNMTLSSNHGLGIFSAYWDYSGYQYYLPTAYQQVLVVVASTSISIDSDSEVISRNSLQIQ